MSDAGPNPSGLCMCGCGEPTSIAPADNKRCGQVQGQPVRYIHNHHMRLSPVEYLEQDCGYETPCWVWQRAKNWDGYGHMQHLGRLCRATRVYYERFVGPIPEGLQLDHLCRNRACVRPSHLEPVTGTENVRRGSHTRLTAQDVLEIRELIIAGVSQPTIARRFGVTRGTISHIATGHSWSDVR